MDKDEFIQRALDYHAYPTPGKLAVCVTKPLDTENDLSLAYTPGVAEPVLAIAKNPDAAYQYTGKGNLVAVITNGSAVLGLGDLGPLASKPVMEGKAALFKQFADIDVFDIEVDAETPEAFIDTVRRIAPGFGGINLEDIKSPECFAIEAALMQQLAIPVFHDDQHGTAVVIAAALLNALELQHKTLDSVRIVCVGAGAAGIASMRLLITLGANPDKLLLLDSQGVIHRERTDLNAFKKALASDTTKRTLQEALLDADVFIGVSSSDLLSADLVKRMAPRPIIFALANPVPEISPAVAHASRDDLIMATGSSSYANQVNNALCFPYIFRGALDVRARCINQAMSIAAVHAIRKLAHEPVPRDVQQRYPEFTQWTFGAEYIIPKPGDPRLKDSVSYAVAQAAITSGVSGLAEVKENDV